MSPTTIPEIQRKNLASTPLQMKAMRINDLLSFDFMDPPSPQALISSMEQLYSLGALHEEGFLTKLGCIMAELPLESSISKIFLEGVYLGCSDEILTIISMIDTGDIFYRPSNKQKEANHKREIFIHPEADHLTLLVVYEAWKANNFSAAWCIEIFVQSRSLRRIQDLGIVSAGKDSTKIRRAIAAGFFFQTVYIHRSSVLFHPQPYSVIYQVLLQTTKDTTKEYMCKTTVIVRELFG
ncbi:hypothetical protein MKW98_023706 [Papaver atlanticum]|uniref:RNA helicase n=1 Tax=Papaver atlanticum TaxID=357466 RepID=A0AAD4SZF2_9MAGN|nr:hypothetical protein MKW98_023706 [Papaver atlanticum]